MPSVKSIYCSCLAWNNHIIFYCIDKYTSFYTDLSQAHSKNKPPWMQIGYLCQEPKHHGQGQERVRVPQKRTRDIRLHREINLENSVASQTVMRADWISSSIIPWWIIIFQAILIANFHSMSKPVCRNVSRRSKLIQT